MTPVFVYGTLRPGCGNDRLWRKWATAAHDGDAYVHGYRLVHNGAFPYAVTDEESVTVGCLVYPLPAFEQDLMARLDALEGVPHHYDRVKVDVDVPGATVTAWMYAPPLDRHITRLPSVPGNDWGRILTGGTTR